MADKDTLFIQKVVHKKSGEEIDLSFLRECTFIETIDLSGPKLIATLSDQDNLIRDRIPVKVGDELECTFADPWQLDGMDEKMNFRIINMPASSGKDAVTLNCFQLDIDSLKTPAVNALMFAKKPASIIIRNLLPGLHYNIDSLPVMEDYHVLPGERPAWMLKQLAREQGSFIFLRRGELCLRRKMDLLIPEPELEYAHNDFQAEYQIVTFSKPNNEFIIQDQTLRLYGGWNMTKGAIRAAVNKGGPLELCATPNVPTLNNIAVVFGPSVEFTAAGHGALMPGIMLKLVWNTGIVDMPIDESLPDKALVGTVSHHYKPGKYFCRVKCIAPMEEIIRE